jgi:hypothetical protein
LEVFLGGLNEVAQKGFVFDYKQGRLSEIEAKVFTHSSLVNRFENEKENSIV